MMDLRYGFIYMKIDVAHLACHKREMPVFGIVNDEVLVGIVVRSNVNALQILE